MDKEPFKVMLSKNR